MMENNMWLLRPVGAKFTHPNWCVRLLETFYDKQLQQTIWRVEHEDLVQGGITQTHLTAEDFEICYEVQPDEFFKEFYKKQNGDYYFVPKQWIIDHLINFNDEDTYKSILKQLDYPYIKNEWEKTVTDPKYFGRYLAKMRLFSFRNYTYIDSDRLNRGTNG